jgi:biotin carboxyl carrier protein
MSDDLELLVEGEPAIADGTEWALTWVEPGPRVAVLRHGTERELIVVEGGPRDWVVTIRGRRIAVTARGRRERLLAASGPAAGPRGGSADVLATLPGLVLRVLVEVDQVVAAGEPLVTIEAMKMQNEIRAPRAGRVQTVAVQPGQAIVSGALLIRLADPEP